MILLILSPISLSPLSATMSAKPPPLGTSMHARSGLPAYLSETYFTNSSDEDVVLVLRGIHAAAQLVAALPEGAVEFGLLDRQCLAASLRVGSHRAAIALNVNSVKTS